MLLPVVAPLARALPPLRGRGRVALALHRRAGAGTGAAIVTVPMRGGYTLAVPSGSAQTWRAAFTGSYDDEEVELLASFIEPGSLVLDVGASLGFYTVPLALAARRRRAHVVAVEPVAANCAVLRRNLERNGLLDTVTVVEAGLGAREGAVTLHVETGGTGNATIVTDLPVGEVRRHDAAGGTGSTATARVVPLDALELPAAHRTRRCSVVKIDAEGFEMEVLAGAPAFLAAHRPVVLGEFSPAWLATRGVDPGAPLAWAEANGYRCLELAYARPNPLSERRRLARRPLPAGAPRSGTSLLLVPRSAGVVEPADVHVSIVSHADQALVRRCLRSLPEACRGLRWACTVVENLPRQGPSLAGEFPWATVVANAAPAGFGPNHNAVLEPVVKAGAARHLLVLNDDTALAPGCVTALVGHLDARPDLGATGPRLTLPGGRRQHSLHAFPTAASVTRAALRPGLPSCRPVEAGEGWISGACLLLRAAAVAETGLFDPRFFLFFEDTDLGARLHAAGWRAEVCPDASAVHFDHQTVARAELAHAMRCQMQRSMYLWFDKHRGPATAGAVALVCRSTLAARSLWAWAGGAVRARPDDRRAAGELLRLARYRPRRPVALSP